MKLSDFNSELGQPRPIQLAGISTQPVSGSLWLGRDSHSQPLQICVFESASALPDGKMERVWEQRRGNTATNVLIVVLYNGTVDMAGPVTRQSVLPLLRNMDAADALRVLKLAKESPDSFTAIKFLHLVFGSIHSELSGLNNSGLFADHILKEVIQEEGSPYNKEFKEASKKAKPLLSKTTKELIQGLGFKVTSNDSRTDILLDADDRQVALAVLLHENESPDSASPAFNNQTPISHALTQASKRNLKWVITLAPDRTIRLYPAVLNVGVGRRGATETFIELHAGLLKDENAGLLWMIFSADALLEKGSVSRLLEDSTRFSGSLAQDLRERIYVEVMPRLAKGIADARRSTNKDDEFLKDTLQMATHVLFRLLFIAYAEDKDLLPYAHSSAYRKSSLKAIAQEILESIRKGAQFGDTTRLWEQVSVLCDSISKGNKTLDIPAYNGVLFSSDKDDSPHGEAISKVKLKDSVFGHVLAGLLLTKGKDGNLGPVDFRSLGVREFGTIYEGLLESELSEAQQDLSIKYSKGEQLYSPSTEKDHTTVKKGEFYLHNKSGARKASGAYFTKEFAVDHLLDLALDKALDDHLAKVSEIVKKSEHDAADLLFDFRVADIAMGSGHFLIYAIDRIERKFREYLITNPLPPVRIQLNELREAARSELGESADILEGRLEDAALLRRLIARRCIYGVDMNPVSVQLAQLAVWIHTFVPGLPLSFLEHNLIQGNSLIGVANQSDLQSVLSGADLLIGTYLDAALPKIKMMASIADKNVSDVKHMKKLRSEALAKLRPAIEALDIAVWYKIKPRSAAGQIELMSLLSDIEGKSAKKMYKEASEGMRQISCRHLITSFPEVFLRPKGGFDVLLGNPPWEKVKFEPSTFWCKHVIGYKGMNAVERKNSENKVIKLIPNAEDLIKSEAECTSELAGMYANFYSDAKDAPARYGKSSGDPDLFKWFAQRFWELLAPGGRMGIVLPRIAFAGDGLEFWRRKIWSGNRGSQISPSTFHITMLTNKGEWVFSGVHAQYTVGLVAVNKHSGDGMLHFNGPFSSMKSFSEGLSNFGSVKSEKLITWTENAALPLLPGTRALALFDKIRSQKDLSKHGIDGLGLIPYNELHSTKHKNLFSANEGNSSRELIKVYKGESFDLWQPDRGIYHGLALSNEKLINHLQGARLSSYGRSGSAFNFFGRKYIENPDTLGVFRPRIVFRDVTNRTNVRTIIACLIPPNTTIADNAVILTPAGFEKCEAFLLGILCSRTADWYARRFVEMHFKLYHFNSLPVPAYGQLLQQELVAAAGRLACPDERFAGWAKSVGVECGPIKPEEKQLLIDRVDAVSALLYDLSEQELETVFETFHEGWDWKPDYARVLAEYRRLKTKFKI